MADEHRTLTITVKTSSAEQGEMVIPSVMPDWTVGDLKAYIQVHHPLQPPVSTQRLVYFGRLLTDADRLSDTLRDLDAGVAHIMHLVISGASQASSPAHSTSSTPVPRSVSAPADGLRYRGERAAAPVPCPSFDQASPVRSQQQQQQQQQHQQAFPQTPLSRSVSAASAGSVFSSGSAQPMSPAEYTQAAQAYAAQYYAAYMRYYQAMGLSPTAMNYTLSAGAVPVFPTPTPSTPVSSPFSVPVPGPGLAAPAHAQAPVPPVHNGGGVAAPEADIPQRVDGNPANLNANNAVNNEDEGGLPVEGQLMTIGQMFVLVLKLAFFVFVFGQHATETRFRILIAVAIAIFLFSSGIVHRLLGRRPGERVNPVGDRERAREAADNNANNQQAENQPANGRAQEREEDAEEEEEETSLLGEIKTIVFAFFGSLIPGRLPVAAQ